jgi:hypothetical protein
MSAARKASRASLKRGPDDKRGPRGPVQTNRPALVTAVRARPPSRGIGRTGTFREIRLLSLASGREQRG